MWIEEKMKSRNLVASLVMATFGILCLAAMPLLAQAAYTDPGQDPTVCVIEEGVD
jgi:hypothetical protein